MDMWVLVYSICNVYKIKWTRTYNSHNILTKNFLLCTLIENLKTKTTIFFSHFDILGITMTSWSLQKYLAEDIHTDSMWGHYSSKFRNRPTIPAPQGHIVIWTRHLTLSCSFPLKPGKYSARTCIQQHQVIPESRECVYFIMCQSLKQG